MRRVDVDELARDPVGRFVSGPSFAHFCQAPSLWGILLWGRPQASDARELGRSLILELEPGVVPHASIVDATRLSGSDPRAFAALERYLSDFGDLLRKQVLCLALLRPRGLHGAVVAGAFEVVPRPYPVAIFDDALQAFAWLGERTGLEGSPAELAAVLAEIHAAATGAPPLVSELRVLLEKELRTASLSALAKSLGVSTRTLQRRLEEHGTSFQEELGAARIRAAESLLLETDAPLTAIAYDVGCASLQHLSALFRQRHGEAPSAWRKRRRTGGMP